MGEKSWFRASREQTRKSQGSPESKKSSGQLICLRDMEIMNIMLRFILLNWRPESVARGDIWHSYFPTCVGEGFFGFFVFFFLWEPLWEFSNTFNFSTAVESITTCGHPFRGWSGEAMQRTSLGFYVRCVVLNWKVSRWLLAEDGLMEKRFLEMCALFNIMQK